MSDLKTLKEMSYPNQAFYTVHKNNDGSDWVTRKDLRFEAFKWVKALQSRQPPTEIINGDKEAAAFSEGIQKGIIGWIMKFFNITEADLLKEKLK